MGLGYNLSNALTGPGKERYPFPAPAPEVLPPVKVPYQHGNPERNDSCCEVNDVENQTVTNAFDAKTFEDDKQRKFDVKMRDNSDPSSVIPI